MSDGDIRQISWADAWAIHTSAKDARDRVTKLLVENDRIPKSVREELRSISSSMSYIEKHIETQAKVSH